MSYGVSKFVQTHSRSLLIISFLPRVGRWTRSSAPFASHQALFFCNAALSPLAILPDSRDSVITVALLAVIASLYALILMIISTPISSARLTPRFVHDEVIDDPVLHAVHKQREYEHYKGNLKGLVAFGPAKHPVPYPRQPREQQEKDQDEELHAYQAEEVE